MFIYDRHYGELQGGLLSSLLEVFNKSQRFFIVLCVFVNQALPLCMPLL